MWRLLCCHQRLSEEKLSLKTQLREWAVLKVLHRPGTKSWSSVSSGRNQQQHHSRRQEEPEWANQEARHGPRAAVPSTTQLSLGQGPRDPPPPPHHHHHHLEDTLTAQESSSFREGRLPGTCRIYDTVILPQFPYYEYTYNNFKSHKILQSLPSLNKIMFLQRICPSKSVIGWSPKAYFSLFYQRIN